MAEATMKLDFRVTPKAKAMVEQAASAAGLSLTAFAREALLSKAESVLRPQHLTVLSDRDWRRFLEIVDSQAEPNAALRKAAKEYKARPG